VSKKSRIRQKGKADSLATNRKRGKSIWVFIGLIFIAIMASAIVFNHLNGAFLNQ